MSENISYQELEKKLKFGSGDERLEAIIDMGKLSDESDKRNALMSLVPVAGGEEARDRSEKMYALLSIMQLNENNFVQFALPETYETVRDAWLETLKDVATVEDDFFSDVFAGMGVNALSLAKGDENVTDGLIEVIKNMPSSEGRSLTNRILRAIGSLGHENGREFLEYWRDKGNISAQAALEAFGSSIEEIEDTENSIEAEKEIAVKAEEKKSKEKKKIFGIDETLFVVLVIVLAVVVSCLLCIAIGSIQI